MQEQIRSQGREGQPRRAVFLDRDGVLNQAVVREGKPYPPTTLDELHILDGVRDTLVALRAAGLRTIVVTNQPDVGSGAQRAEVVHAMHDHLMAELDLDAIEVCFHEDEARCDCRKPKPGMLIRAAKRWGIDLGASYLVGDRWRDVAAGRAVGAMTFWLDRGYRERSPESPDNVVASLAEAGRLILSELEAEKNRDE